MKSITSLLHLLLCAWVGLATAAGASAADRRRNAVTTKTPAKAATKAADASTVSPAQSFEAFAIVVERNIFNPNRVGRVRPTTEEKPQRVDEVALVGTIQYDRENLAIFDSRDATYRKAFREGDVCGEFQVRRITADRVELTQGEKKLSLKVAQQLRRVEGGEWKVTAVPPRSPEPGPGAKTAAVPGRPSAPPPPVVEIPANASEVLKRLMKAREQQLKK